MTAPNKFALSSRGTQAAQGLTDLDADTTLLSINGIGAFDLVSRAAMMRGSWRLKEADQPFPSDISTDHLPHTGGMVLPTRFVKGESGEQGDALMPALFSLDIHAASCAVNHRLLQTERLLTFLDDIHTICRPERVSCMWRSKKSCGPIHGHRSIKGKHNC